MRIDLMDNTNDPVGRLRLLETTDLHMQLLDHDYLRNRPDPGAGLVRLADQIKALRQEPGVTTLLCDNGDLLQGNPLADHIAHHWQPGQAHPMIAALDLLGYDAITLGNHDFDYGLSFLADALGPAHFATVSANISCPDGPQILQPYVLITRQIACSDGTDRPLHIGITGFAPPRITDRETGGRVRSRDILLAANDVVPQMRAAGADLIVGLCHTGLGAADHQAGMENAAIPLARQSDIDIFLLGHSHQRLPDPTPGQTGPDHVDLGRGTIAGKPAVMAGCYGRALGVIDLDLSWGDYGWVIRGHQSQLLHADPDTPSDSALQRQLRSLVAAPQKAALAALDRPLARTTGRISSYFATIRPDASQQLLADVMRRGVARALAGGPQTKCPILVAIAPFHNGGRYVDIAPGPITLHDAALLFPFEDRLVGLRRTGAQLRMWLERAVAHYARITPGVMDQPLINAGSAGYNCDCISGLSYRIDLTQPAQFDTLGQQVAANATRITKLCYQGHPVHDDDIFVLATNSFRTRGGGNYPALASLDIVWRSEQTVRDLLVAYLAENGLVSGDITDNWGFAPLGQTAATFVSAAAAVDLAQGPISHIADLGNDRALYRIEL